MNRRTRSGLPVKGDVIICPGCKDRIATLTRDLFLDDRITANMFLFTAHQRREPGEPTRCRHCSRLWFMAGRLHTERGWR